MILTSKQLEELEHLHDSVSEFDEEANVGSDNEDFDEASESALAWRRGMLERAAATVKKNQRAPLSSKENYPVGTLVYDTTHNRFARVKESNRNQAVLVYVSGGEAILKGSHIQITQALRPTITVSLKKKPEAPPAKTNVSKAAQEKKKPVKPVIAPQKNKKTTSKKTNSKNPVPKKTAIPKKKILIKKITPIKKTSAAKKKPAPTSKTKKKNKIFASKKSTKKILPIKKTSINPDAFIKKNYKKMSNKELAIITGLSEHTIRRKLGEWGLKRPAK